MVSVKGFSRSDVCLRQMMLQAMMFALCASDVLAVPKLRAGHPHPIMLRFGKMPRTKCDTKYRHH